MEQNKARAFANQAVNMGYNPGVVAMFVRSKLLGGQPRNTTSPVDVARSLAGETPQNLGETISSILGKMGPITQKFGNRSAVERYSRGINYGTDIAVPTGTKVALPPGVWKVVEAFNGATASGPNNKQRGINRGYGNSVLVQNAQTGEKLRFSHLSKVGARKGDTIQGGRVVGLTGATGNVAGRTGQHLDLEYYNQQGKVADVLKSAYRRYLGG